MEIYAYKCYHKKPQEIFAHQAFPMNQDTFCFKTFKFDDVKSFFPVFIPHLKIDQKVTCFIRSWRIEYEKSLGGIR